MRAVWSILRRQNSTPFPRYIGTAMRKPRLVSHYGTESLLPIMLTGTISPDSKKGAGLLAKSAAFPFYRIRKW